MNTHLPRYNIAPYLANTPVILIRPYYLYYSKNFTRDPRLTYIKVSNRLVYKRYRRLNKPCYLVSRILNSKTTLLTNIGSLII